MSNPPSPLWRVTFALAVTSAASLVLASSAGAAEAPVGLGTAGSFAVLAGSTVTNTGPSVVRGDLGLSPGTAIVGFPPGLVQDGTVHATDAVAAQAQVDLTTAYDDAAGRSSSATVSADLGGQTLLPGVYTGATLALTGTLTLDAQGDPDAVFVFQSGSSLVTASSSSVSLVGSATACNVFWQVTSSATLGTASSFVGSVLALTSITATTGAVIDGRLLARNGAVTLDDNVFTGSACGTTPTPTPTTPTTDVPPTTAPSGDGGATTPEAAPLTTTVPTSSSSATSVPSATADTLPRTGAPVRLPATAGSLLVLAGAVMVWSSRARRA